MPFLAPIIPFLPAIGSGIAGVLGRNQDQNQADWTAASQMDIFNYLREANQFARDRYLQQFGPFTEEWARQMGPLGAFLGGSGGEAGAPFGLWDQLGRMTNQQEGAGGLMDIFRNTGMYTTPEMQEALAQMNQRLGPMGDTRGIAQQLFAGGGWNPIGQRLYDRGFDLLEGRGAEMYAPAQLGLDIFGQGGATNTSAFLREQMPGFLSQLSGGIGSALDWQSGGQTPTGAEAQRYALNALQGQGQTPLTQFLGGRGAEFAGQEALLPLEKAVGFAREDAATAINQQAEAAMRKALARGGGPGAVVASGLQNEGMADFARDAAQLESQAIRDALTKQQGLQLQQQDIGRQTAQGAAQAENQRLATYADLIASLENVGQQRFGAGLRGAEAGSRFGLDALNAELGRLALGRGTLSDYNTQRLQAMNQLGDVLKAQQGYTLGGGELANRMFGTEQGVLQNIFGNWLGGGELGVRRGTDIASALNNAYRNQLGQSSDFMNFFSNLMTPWANTMNQAMGQWGAGVRSPFQPTPAGSSWPGYIQSGLDFVGSMPWGNRQPPTGGTGPAPGYIPPWTADSWEPSWTSPWG